jgi:hypothetical protein
VVLHAAGRLRRVLSADGDRDAQRDGGRSLKDGAGRDDRVPPALQQADVGGDLPGPGGRGEGAVNRGADAQVDDEPHDLGGHGDGRGGSGDRVPGDAGRNSREGGGDEPMTPGSGIRRSPYSCTRPITLVSAPSLTWASAGRCTIAQNTSVP